MVLGEIECDRIVRTNRKQTLVSRILRMFRRALRIKFKQVMFNFSISLFSIQLNLLSQILKYARMKYANETLSKLY